MTSNHIVVVGASAGGVEALRTIIGALPGNFSAPLFIVLHIPPHSPSMLPEILQRETALTVKSAEHGETIRRRTIYIAPPDHHLLIHGDRTVAVVRGPRENRHRPAIDPLFRSAAMVAGPDAVGVILTGTLDDGTAGLLAIRQRGGTAIVQDPADALYPDMPQSVLAHVDVQACLPLSGIAAAIAAAVQKPRSTRPEDSGLLERMKRETRVIEMAPKEMQTDQRPGTPSAYSCPDCGGVLWEVADGEYVRYRCRVGHAFSPETMLSAQAEVLEEALWTALKTLDESARLAARLGAEQRSAGHAWVAARFEQREREARERADTIRRFLVQEETIPDAGQETTQAGS